MAKQSIAKTGASIFKKFYYKLKVAVATIVRVWNICLSGMVAQEIGHTDDASALLVIVTHTDECSIIVVVHGNYYIKYAEIVSRHLSSTTVEAIAMTCAVAAHSAVWQLSNVPVADSR